MESSNERPKAINIKKLYSWVLVLTGAFLDDFDDCVIKNDVFDDSVFSCDGVF